MTTTQKMLEDMASIYAQKETDIDIAVQFKSLSDGHAWFLCTKPGKPVKITDSCQGDPDIIFSFTEETLSAIHSGDMTGLTSMGRENISDKTPLDFALDKGVALTPSLMANLLAFVQRFFNPTHPERILLDKSSARLVHGGWAIPMFYHSGFRSAWYQIDQGQKLNEPGDTNPFSQAFVIISGNGYAKIGENNLKIKSGEAYYIPPGSDHVIWNETPEPIQIIYLAWGQNA